MRFLFTTLQYIESDFYGTVARELERRGHQVRVTTVSRRSAKRLRATGVDGVCVHDVSLDGVAPSLEDEVRRLTRTYGLGSLDTVHADDAASPPAGHRSSAERTVRYFRVVEALFDRFDPDVLVPEVGNETLRIAAHHVALDRGVPTLFPFHSIFPRPLRLYRDSLTGPWVERDELRELADTEREEVRAFIAAYTARATPVRAHRRLPASGLHARRLLRHTAVKLGPDRDNEYLRPVGWARDVVAEAGRRRLATRHYAPVPAEGHPFLYFPLHDARDYKMRRLLPHLADQAEVVEALVAALPDGLDLVVKEHPMAIGRTPLATLRRLTATPGVHLVPPTTNSHLLMQRARAVTVIGSTVGLEALLYRRPVLTMGWPYYAGQGVTVDVDGVSELPAGLRRLLTFQPDPEWIDRFLHAAMRRSRPGRPVLVDPSPANAAALAASLHEVGIEAVHGAPDVVGDVRDARV